MTGHGNGGKGDRVNRLTVVRGYADTDTERVNEAHSAFVDTMPDSEPGYLDVIVIEPTSAQDRTPAIAHRRVDLSDARASLLEIGSHMALAPDWTLWFSLALHLDSIDGQNRTAEIPGSRYLRRQQVSFLSPEPQT